MPPKIYKNYALKSHNTFGVEVFAKIFSEVSDQTELQELLKMYPNEKKLIIGEGSNILFTKNFDGLVIAPSILGKKVTQETEKEILIEVGAGELWHNLVLWAGKNNFGGIENLSLIPGKVGTAPVQNIGAYGVEISSVIDSVQATHIDSFEEKIFTNAQCLFGYRNSFFKTEEGKKWIITKVNLKLTKKDHRTNILYKPLADFFEGKTPTIQAISEKVSDIRQNKLPDPKTLGNAGSFFKNPILDKKASTIFRQNFPEAPFYEQKNSSIKIPAAWLIEQCGFKGKKESHVGTHKNQPLVLVNFGGASGKEILAFSQKIQLVVQQQFGITLEREIRVI